MIRKVLVMTMVLLGALAMPATAWADGSDGKVDGGVVDGHVVGGVVVTSPDQTGGNEGGSGGSGGPNCTQDDGTRAYFRYEGLQFTTMEEQYNEIRPEEQRPGVYLHVYCGEDYRGLQFFVDPPAAVQIDPQTLAQQVRITPEAPVLRTSPATGNHLVNLEAWYWTESWEGLEQSASAGAVTVTVFAQPTKLIVDPGDGSAPFECAGPQAAYDDRVSAADQSSTCTHTYRRAGRFTATATIVYEVGFTSNIGVSGDLGTVEPDSATPVTVRESQAVVG